MAVSEDHAAHGPSLQSPRNKSSIHRFGISLLTEDGQSDYTEDGFKLAKGQISPGCSLSKRARPIPPTLEVNTPEDLRPKLVPHSTIDARSEHSQDSDRLAPESQSISASSMTLTVTDSPSHSISRGTKRKEGESDLSLHRVEQPCPRRAKTTSYNETPPGICRFETGASWETFESLRREIDSLKDERLKAHVATIQASTPQMHTLHQVHCLRLDEMVIFRDAPSSFGKSASSHIQGEAIVDNIDLFVAKEKGSTAFLVLRNYQCCQPSSPDEFSTEDGMIPESILIVSNDFAQALNRLTDLVSKPPGYFSTFIPGTYINAPYYWYYHSLSELLDKLQRCQQILDSMCTCSTIVFLERFGQVYNEVDSQLANGYISCLHFRYLFSPGTILVPLRDTLDQAFVQESWPKVSKNGLLVQAANWSFDGSFSKVSQSVELIFGESARTEPRVKDETKAITELGYYPIDYTSPQVRDRLYKVGREFWSCRHRKFVSYSGWDVNGEEWDVRLTVPMT